MNEIEQQKLQFDREKEMMANKFQESLKML